MAQSPSLRVVARSVHRDYRGGYGHDVSAAHKGLSKALRVAGRSPSRDAQKKAKYR